MRPETPAEQALRRFKERLEWWDPLPPAGVHPVLYLAERQAIEGEIEVLERVVARERRKRAVSELKAAIAAVIEPYVQPPLTFIRRMLGK